jgi:hypothetical protein
LEQHVAWRELLRSLIQAGDAHCLAHVVALCCCSGNGYLRPSGGGFVMKREEKRQAAWIHRGDLAYIDHNVGRWGELLVDALG